MIDDFASSLASSRRGAAERSGTLQSNRFPLITFG